MQPYLGETKDEGESRESWFPRGEGFIAEEDAEPGVVVALDDGVVVFCKVREEVSIFITSDKIRSE